MNCSQALAHSRMIAPIPRPSGRAWLRRAHITLLSMACDQRERTSGTTPNGGSACGYQTGFGLLASLVRVQCDQAPYVYASPRLA